MWWPWCRRWHQNHRHGLLEALIRPAFTKLTTITVEALELWIRAVIAIPVSTPVTRFLVIMPRILRSLSPATFCSPSLITFIP